MTDKRAVFVRGCRLVAVLGLVFCGDLAVCREPVMIGEATVQAGAGLSQVESAVIAKTNAARARNGLPPLAVDPSLMNRARNHARWMAGSQNLAHGSGVAENIAMGQTSASEAVSSWMNSSGHRSNMLDGGHTRIGVGVAYSSNGTAYWCQQFR